MLLVSAHVCDVCHGSKVAPRPGRAAPPVLSVKNTAIKAPRFDDAQYSLPEPDPWVLIDSEEVARSFVGKRVEVDAPACGDYPQSGWHGDIMHVEYSNDTSLFAPIGDVAWRLRGNVRLRVVGEDP